ncbi:hypothetical protein M079_1925 [Bacteroides fragilis str. 3996 N(B) 6]|nr:hypothetical protein M079_1925 [Bacteroides fragilis str. 3996 N(B) 6]
MVGLQFQACHDIIGTQPYGVGRLLAVSLLRLFLPFPALVFPLDDGDERGVYVRCFLVPMQVRRYDVLLSERVGKVFHIRHTTRPTPSLSMRSMSSCVPDTLMQIACTWLLPILRVSPASSNLF